MTMFGLKEAEVSTLVREIAGDELDHEAVRDRFARATWTGVAEPGDRMAGLLAAALGAATALDAVVEHWTVERLHAVLDEAGVTEGTSDELRLVQMLSYEFATLHKLENRRGVHHFL